ncbi:hypothetical protein [Oscillibacter ruminantium]|uniref:hypothetical protein n=1 Tax=Oscillibacter ruminantium TaxID=1263547 RepID=UPI00058BE1E8|nr:hypothetical protein [Oscillibacter ruminantium]
MDLILLLLYFWAGYWAAGLVLFYNKIVIGGIGALFLQRLAFGAIFGWALIPIALIMKLFRIR